MPDQSKIADGVYRVDSGSVKLEDGSWQTSGATSAYLVESEAKLASIPDASPGDIAFTAGYTKLWQMDTDEQTWVAIG